MSWNQNSIPVRWIDGFIGEGTQVGNNAAWLCRCGRVLLSPSWEHFGRAPASLACPTCGKQWDVISPGNNQAPTEVRER